MKYNESENTCLIILQIEKTICDRDKGIFL